LDSKLSVYSRMARANRGKREAVKEPSLIAISEVQETSPVE
jgi:hypothetical protein